MQKIFLIAFLIAWCGIRPAPASTGPDSSLQALSRELGSVEPASRLEAVRSIAINYPAAGLHLLVQAAGDRDEYVRERAIQGLASSGSPKAIDPVRLSLKDPDEFVRWRSVQALARLGVHDVVGDLAPLVKDESWRVKVCTLELLGTIAAERMKMSASELSHPPLDQRIKPLLLSGLEDRDERVRFEAAAALARNKDSAAFEPLIYLLRNGSMFIRDRAGLALGELGDKKAVEPLLEALSDRRNEACDEGSDWARWGMVKSLTMLTGQDFGIEIGKWKPWYESNRPR